MLNQIVVLPGRFDLYQRPSSEEVSKLILLPVLATVRRISGENLVVRMTQCVATSTQFIDLSPFFRMKTKRSSRNIEPNESHC